MSSVEAAASLFGPEDESSDPFASLGETNQSFVGDADDTFASNFLAQDPIDDQYQQQNTLQNQHTPNYTSQSRSLQSYDANPYSLAAGINGSQQNMEQQWGNDSSQLESYYSSTHFTNVQSNAFRTSHSHSHQQAYSTYTPSASSVSAATPTYPSSLYSYTPPLQQTNTLIQHANTASNFSSPAIASSVLPHGSAASQPPFAHQPPVLTSVPQPPVPVPSATLSRPKVTNAYDPPFPTISSRRSAPSRGGTASVQASYSAYAGYSGPAVTPPQASSYVSAGGYSRPASVPLPPAPPAQTPGLSGQSVPLQHSAPGPQSQYTPATYIKASNEQTNPQSTSAYDPYAPNQASANVYSPYGSQTRSSTVPPSQNLSTYPYDVLPPPPATSVPSQDIFAPPRPQSRVQTLDQPPLVSPPLIHQAPPPPRAPLSRPASVQSNASVPPPRSNSIQSTTSARLSPPRAPSRNVNEDATSSWPSENIYKHAAPPTSGIARVLSPEAPSMISSGPTSHLQTVSESEISKHNMSSASFSSLSRATSPETLQGYDSPRLPHTSPKKSTRAGPSYTAQPFALERSSSPAPLRNNGRQTPQPPSTLYQGLNRSGTPNNDAFSAGNLDHGGTAGISNTYAPYVPANAITHESEKVMSPANYSTRPIRSASTKPTVSSQLSQNSARDRSMSSSTDPYAPTHQARRQAIESSNSLQSSRYNYGQDVYGSNGHGYETPSQDVVIKPAQNAYAPSPSLLGANDVLGRTSSKVPIFSFGFGGKFVTCFHGVPTLNTGFDVALSSRNTTGVHIRQLKELISVSALENSSAIFPGPLLSDPGSPTTSLVRTGAATQAKSKKANVIKYLEERIKETSQGLAYISLDTPEGRQIEGRLVIMRLLKIMVDNDGRLSNSPQTDAAIRESLLPQLEGTLGTPLETTLTPATAFSPMADIRGIDPAASTSDISDPVLANSTLRGSSLDKIQKYLLRGERRQAYHYALDEKLWAHAMVIASSIDKEAWKEVVNEFIRSELGIKDQPNHTFGNDVPTNGREGLKVAYSLFSGQGSASVQELAPQTLLARAAAGVLPVPPPPAASQVTPRTQNLAAPAIANSIPTTSLSNWAETAAMMLSYPLTQEVSAALTALGDQLSAHQWIDAAHACYLLSLQTAHLGGLGNPSARLILVGSRSPQVYPGFVKDQDAFIFSEILEFALSLTPPGKGQEPLHSIPHLQAYKLIRASYLMDLGDIQCANRYCEAITASLAKPSPYFTPILVEQLRSLTERILGVSSDKAGSWMSAKLSKPRLDTIGGWLEGRFTKLVTGDADTPTAPESAQAKLGERTFAGPFTTISSTTSTSPSPQPGFSVPTTLPPRSGSTLGVSHYGHPPIDRASTAMDYVKRRASPSPSVPRIASANAATTTFAQSSTFGSLQANSVYAYQDMLTPRASTINASDSGDAGGQNSGWWNSTSSGDTSVAQTPTATPFHKLDDGVTPSDDGFISLMDSTPLSVGPSATSKPQNTSTNREYDDGDDLGLGNPRKEKLNREASPAPKSEAEKPAAPPAQQQANGGWLSRWWGKKEVTPGPVKASLGEESSFYYDKDLKKWVNKKGGAEEATKPPPPPPPRAATASPGMAFRSQGGPGFGPPSGPPTRPGSTIDLSSSPPIMRSNTGMAPDSAPPSPSGTRMSLPTGPNRPKSQAAKRNVRNRYVDVFQQGNPS